MRGFAYDCISFIFDILKSCIGEPDVLWMGLRNRGDKDVSSEEKRETVVLAQQFGNFF